MEQQQATLSRHLGIHHRAVYRARIERAAGNAARAAEFDERAERAAAAAARMGASAIIVGAPILSR